MVITSALTPIVSNAPITDSLLPTEMPSSNNRSNISIIMICGNRRRLRLRNKAPMTIPATIIQTTFNIYESINKRNILPAKCAKRRNLPGALLYNLYLKSYIILTTSIDVASFVRPLTASITFIPLESVILFQRTTPLTALLKP